MVPGGQTIFALPDGSINYTQAHGAMVPWEQNACCPFQYQITSGLYGELCPASWAFGAKSLMACPDAEGSWVVMLGLQNATVPSGNVSDCIGFNAMTEIASEIGAWQYT